MPPGRPVPRGRRSTGRLSRGFIPDGVRRLANAYGLFSLKAQTIVSHIHYDAVALPEVPLEHPQREWVEHAALDRPLQRSRPVHRVVTLGDDQALGRLGQLDVDLAIFEPLQE